MIILDDIRRFPVVQESSDYLLQTGVNTLQKTSLLRKAVEVQLVDEELAQKRVEFEERMKSCKAKQNALMKRQEKIQERVRKFGKFLKENEAKRARALQKYQLEIKNNKKRSRELTSLQSEIARLRDAKSALLTKLETYKKFEDFLSQFVDALPEGFLPMSGDNMIENCIQRYEALAATQLGLIERNKERAVEIEEGQRRVELLKQERNKQQLLFNQEITELLHDQESLMERNSRLEQTISEDRTSRRFMASVFGQTLLAIDNLATTCHSRHWPPVIDMSYVDKLSMIKNHVLERIRVLKLIQRYREAQEEKPEPISTKLPSLSTHLDKPSASNAMIAIRRTVHK